MSVAQLLAHPTSVQKVRGGNQIFVARSTREITYHLYKAKCISTISQYCIVLYCIALHCIVLYCIALHCIALHCIVLSSLVLSCLVLSCLVLALSSAEASYSRAMGKIYPRRAEAGNLCGGESCIGLNEKISESQITHKRKLK